MKYGSTQYKVRYHYFCCLISVRALVTHILLFPFQGQKAIKIIN